MDIRTRYVVKGYWAYICPNCIGGTMAWEQDKIDDEPYLKCVLCGEELRKEKFFRKSQRNARKDSKSEAKSKELDENKQNKTHKKDYKWQFTHAQSENK